MIGIEQRGCLLHGTTVPRHGKELMRRIPWSRLAIEAVVIVASILLAFAIDAWWEGVKDRGAEAEILEGLELEFERNLANLERRGARNERFVDGLTSLLALDVDTSEWPGVVGLDSMLLAAIFTPTWDPSGGVRDALEASGRLELIRNPDLRVRLAAWPAVVEDTREGEIQIRQLVHQSISPHLGSMGISLSRAFGTAMHWPPPIQTEAEAELAYRALASDAQLRALLEVRLAWQIVTVGEYAAAKREASEILELIRESTRN